MSIVPDESVNSGHFPFVGLMLAFLWRIFGINLWIGHLVMLPFALGLIWQIHRLILRFIEVPRSQIALLIVIIDTSVLAQMVMLTGELIQLFFLFLSINAILYGNRKNLFYSLVLLALTGSRGIFSCVMVGIFDLYYQYRYKSAKQVIKSFLKLMPGYIPAILITGCYLIYHKYKTGWIGYNPVDSNWAPLFEKVGLRGVVRNVFIVGWRLVDFGKLILWIVAGYFGLMLFGRKIKMDKKAETLFTLYIISLIVFTPTMLIYKGLLAHRYLLPSYIIFAALVVYFLLEKLKNIKLRKAYTVIILLGLISGNFWIYPDHIAKGWDATLAHIPYYKLRRDMLKYIDENNIPVENTGSEVPNVTKMKYIDLTDDERSFHVKDFDKDEYILYSNVFNMFTDEELHKLKTDWEPVKIMKLLQVKMILYKKPQYEIKEK